MTLIGRCKKKLLSCCVSDSHHPTRQEVALGGDDSSFVAVWYSPYLRTMMSALSPAGTRVTEGSPSKNSCNITGFHGSQRGVEHWVGMGVAGAKSLGKSPGGILGYPSKSEHRIYAEPVCCTVL